MLKKETVTSFKVIFDKYFDTDIKLNEAETFAQDLLQYMSQITKPIPVSEEEKFKSYSLKSREDVLTNKIDI